MGLRSRLKKARSKASRKVKGAKKAVSKGKSQVRKKWTRGSKFERTAVKVYDRRLGGKKSAGKSVAKAIGRGTKSVTKGARSAGGKAKSFGKKAGKSVKKAGKSIKKTAKKGFNMTPLGMFANASSTTKKIVYIGAAGVAAYAAVKVVPALVGAKTGR